jgi:hypothetical protein
VLVGSTPVSTNRYHHVTSLCLLGARRDNSGDSWGLSWQITPRALTDALAAGGAEAKRAFEAMIPMKKIDVATIEAARRG